MGVPLPCIRRSWKLEQEVRGLSDTEYADEIEVRVRYLYKYSEAADHNMAKCQMVFQYTCAWTSFAIFTTRI